MIKTFTVESTCNDMRIDRWLRNKLGNIPQGFIEIMMVEARNIFGGNRPSYTGS